jgi:hypothetical protein
MTGETIPIQILIGEGPGGDSGFMLMVQKQDADGTTKGDTAKGDYPVFQVAGGEIPSLGPNAKFSYKKMLFQGAP